MTKNTKIKQLVDIKRISQAQLQKSHMLHLLLHSKSQLSRFIVTYDRKIKVLLVSPDIPETDTEKFQMIASYTGPYINDIECEIRPIIEEICNKYGDEVYMELYEAYRARRDESECKQAEKKAEKIGSAINELLKDENYSAMVLDNELLMYYIQNSAPQDRRTIRNKVGYETIFVFLLGYLMGKGVIHDV